MTADVAGHAGMFTTILLDRINKMDMMPTDTRDVHADVLDMINMMFEILSDEEVQDYRDAVGFTAMYSLF